MGFEGVIRHSKHIACDLTFVTINKYINSLATRAFVELKHKASKLQLESKEKKQ
jgi:hypothetical protein